MTKRPGESTAGNAIAGGAIGMLVGVAAGLSSAPVIAALMGAISAGLLILLGLKKGSPAGAEDENAGAHTARIASFGIVCTLALVLGVMARAYDVLSPSVKQLEQNWHDAGFSDQQAREISLYQKVGLTSAKGDNGFVANRATAAGAQSSSLFSAAGKSACTYFDRHNYGSTDDMLNAMKLQGGSLAEFANSVNQLAPAQRDDIVNAAGKMICAP